MSFVCLYFLCGGLCVTQGWEDEAEEALLQLIRDPYNLADASWTPESAADTAEWKRLEVCVFSMRKLCKKSKPLINLDHPPRCLIVVRNVCSRFRV